MSDDASKFSLKKELHKRKTKEFDKVIEARRTAQTAPSPTSPTRRPGNVGRVPAAQTTPTTPRIEPVPAAVRPDWPSPTHLDAARPLNRAQRRIVVGAALGMLFVFLVVAGGLAREGAAVPASDTAITPLPNSSAANVIDYLRQVGFSMSGVSVLAVPNKTWTAQAGVKITVQQGDRQGDFLLLSYESASKAGIDVIRSAHLSYRTWQSTQMANVLLLASPQTDPTLRSAILSHMAQLLLAPYQSFLPTATPGAK